MKAGPEEVKHHGLSEILSLLPTHDLFKLIRFLTEALGEEQPSPDRAVIKEYLFENLTTVSSLRRLYQKLSFDEQIFLNETLAHDNTLPALWYFRIKYERDPLTTLYYRLMSRDGLLSLFLFQVQSYEKSLLTIIPADISYQLHRFVTIGNATRISIASRTPPFLFAPAEGCLTDFSMILEIADQERIKVNFDSWLLTIGSMRLLNQRLICDEPRIFQPYRRGAAENSSLSIRIQGLIDILFMAGLVQCRDGHVTATDQALSFHQESEHRQLELLFERWLAASQPDELRRLDGIRYTRPIFNQDGGADPEIFTPRPERVRLVIEALKRIRTTKWITVDSFVRKFGIEHHDFLRTGKAYQPSIIFAYQNETEIQREVRTNHDRWLAFEGQYLIAIMAGYLANLGILNFAYEQFKSETEGQAFYEHPSYLTRFQTMEAFQITEIGQYLLKKIPKLPQTNLSKKFPIKLNAEGNLAVNPSLLSPKDQKILARFTEPIENSEFQFAISDASLELATGNGLSLQSIRRYLRRNLHPHDYLQLRKFLDSWRLKHRPFRLESVYLIIAPKSSQLTKLLLDPDCRLKIKRISKHHAVIYIQDRGILEQYCLKHNLQLRFP